MEQNNIQTDGTTHDHRKSEEYLEELYVRLRRFEEKLDDFLNRPDSDLAEIGSVTNYISNLKKEIALLESDLRMTENPKKPIPRVLYDNQSILSTSSVRRKEDRDLRPGRPKDDFLVRR